MVDVEKANFLSGLKRNVGEGRRVGPTGKRYNEISVRELGARNDSIDEVA